MKKTILRLTFAIFSISFLLWAGSKTGDTTVKAFLLTKSEYFGPTPYELEIPEGFPTPKIPSDNQLTVEGIALGRHLFWDKILSKNNKMSCAGCHAPNAAFTDVNTTSLGVEGVAGKRNAMPLFNLAWSPKFLWDGSAETLEEQILNPVRDPIEMHLAWKDATKKLSEHPKYPAMFAKAFGKNVTIDSTSVTKAIGQFLRTMVSANSKYDKALLARDNEVQLTEQELNGLTIFTTLSDGQFGHCTLCHGNMLFSETVDYFRNNGLDAWQNNDELDDLGLGGHSGLDKDIGKFKAVSLRNIELTAPYMHDGRFKTLEEVIDFYISDVQQSPTLDPIMRDDFLQVGDLSLPENGKEDLIAFLKTLTDWDFVNDTSFHSPF